jgi:translation initiation factor 2 subunit 3
MEKISHPRINIGVLGHVDHGKTTIVEALTGQWVSRYSEEKKRGITIRLGYTDFSAYRCSKCLRLSTTPKCIYCFSDCNLERKFSLVDAPGHESLIPIVLSGASLFDAAILVIAANEPCPQPQTVEHFRAIQIGEIKNIIVVQNKVDLVPKEEAVMHFKKIKEFLKGTIAENAPIIPASAQQKLGIEFLIDELMKLEDPKPQEGDPLFLIARSFDANKPGEIPEKISGGVIGGSMIRGTIKKGDSITIKPPIINGKYTEIETTVRKIMRGSDEFDEATPGGLVALQTGLDPSLAKSDKLVGCIAGSGELPKTITSFKACYKIFEGYSIKANDNILVTCRNSRSTGTVKSINDKELAIELRSPICADEGGKIGYSKLIEQKWRLVGWGKVK